MPGTAPSVHDEVHIDTEAGLPRAALLDLHRRLDAALRQARACIEAGDVAGKTTAVDHAFAVLGQLEVALDHALSPELCRDLAFSYAFCKGRLLQASEELETAPLDEAARVLAPIHEAFERVAER